MAKTSHGADLVHKGMLDEVDSILIATYRVLHLISLTQPGNNDYIRSMNDAALFSIALKEAATISAGYPLRVSADSLAEGGVAFVQLKNVDLETGIDWSSVSKLELPPGRKPRWLSTKDVIFASRGLKNFAYPIIEPETPSVCSPHFYVLSIKDTDRLNPEFLAWQINQPVAQNYFNITAVGTKAIKSIRRAAMEDLPVIIPPMAEQLTIVKFWRAAQKEKAAFAALIEKNTQLSHAIAHGLHQRAKGTN